MSKISCLLLLILSNSLFAQTEFSIHGTIKDHSGMPIPNAVIILENNADSSILKTAVPDSLGIYSIHNPTIVNTSIKVSALGFETKSQAVTESNNREITLDFTLKKSENQLAEVVISQTKPLFERKIDRIVFNIANSIASAGSDALEMIRKAPGVIVNPIDNNISLVGKGAARIMVNGRLLQLSGDDLVAYLQAIPSDNIDRIEVITNPPAKYDASGSSGLIDIILKKNNKSGLNGLIRAGYAQASYGTITGGGNLNFRKDKWNVYANVNYSKAKNQIIERLNTPYTSNTLNMNDNHLRTLQPLSYTLGMDYEVHKNGIIGFVFQGNNFWRSDDDNITNRVIAFPENNVDSLMNTLGDSRQYRENNALNLNYEWRIDSSGKKLSINANQFWHAGNRHKDFGTKNYIGEFISPTGIETKNKTGGTQDISITAVQADMELPYKWVSFSFGGKISFVQNKSSNQYQYFEDDQFMDDPNLSNAFDYSENVQALYASAQRTIGKWGFQAGLRAEFTQTKGYSISLNQTNTNQYFQLFPTGYLQYKLNNFSSFNLNYSKRINRPGYGQLDPFRSYSSPYFYSEGNPFLQPYFSHNLELGYSLKYKYFFSAFCQFAHNSIDQIWLMDSATHVTSIQFGNYYNTQNFGLSAMASFQPTRWWELQTQAYFSFQRLSSDYYAEFVQSKVPTVYLYTNSTFAFNSSKTFLAELNGYYSGKGQMGLFEWQPSFGINGGLKGLFFNQTLVLSINVNDIFNSTNNMKALNKYTGQSMRNDLDQQNIRFTASYKFGNAKIKSERNRKTGIEEEKGRM